MCLVCVVDRVLRDRCVGVVDDSKEWRCKFGGLEIP